MVLSRENALFLINLLFEHEMDEKTSIAVAEHLEREAAAARTLVESESDGSALMAKAWDTLAAALRHPENWAR